MGQFVNAIMRKSGAALPHLQIFQLANYSRDRIIPAATPGMAGCYSLRCKPQALDHAVLSEGFNGIVGAGGCIPAFGTQPGRYHPLVDPDQKYEGEAKKPEYEFH